MYTCTQDNSVRIGDREQQNSSGNIKHQKVNIPRQQTNKKHND